MLSDGGSPLSQKIYIIYHLIPVAEFISLFLSRPLLVVAFELLRSAKMYWQRMKRLLKILEVSTWRKWLGFILVTGVKRITLTLYNMNRRQKPRWCQWWFCCSNTD